MTPRGTQLFTSLCLPYSSQLFPGGKAAPQVLKTQTKFQAGVRFLLGLRFLGAPAKPPLVRADMVTEKQARELSMPQGPGAGA